MLVMTDVISDPRVRKEAETLRDVGHDVTIIGHVQPPGGPALDGIEVHWVERGQVGDPSDAGHDLRALPGARAARWLLLPDHRRRARSSFASKAVRTARGLSATFDVVHAHDLPALVPGAELAGDHGARLVYDAHEVWTGRRLEGRPTPLGRRREFAREHHLGARADTVLTVSEGIASWLRDHHGWTSVHVVRNTYRLGASFRPPSGPPSAVVFTGRVDRDRDLETAVQAAQGFRGLELQVFASRVVGVDIPSHHLREPVPEDDVDLVLRRAGIALVSLTGGMVNHDLALPNKLFHAVRAGVPVVAADLPELRRVVSSHDLGTLYTPGDPDSLAKAVNDVRDNWDRHVAAVASARTALSWAVDARVLADVYSGMAGR